jgi:MFS family permease
VAFLGSHSQFQPRQMISSLRERNYRLFFFGQLISVIGTWMQTVAQSFLVLDLTHSGTQLGLTLAVRFLPIFAFGPLGGLFADRMDKRRVLLVTQTLSGLLAGAFAVLIATGSIRLWIVYLLALALGFVNVFDNPARQSFISEMVSPSDLANAVTLNSVAMNMARVFGAALGGVIAAAIGLALCFGCNAISFAAVLISLVAMRKSKLFPAKRVGREKGQVRQGLRYVRGTPELLIPLVMIAVVGTLAWEFQVTLPLMATNVFHGGAAAYGVMASVMGAGAVVGGLISAARPRPRARALCLAAIGWGIAILAAAAAPSARAGGHGLRRLREHHLQLLRQDHAPAGRQAGDARPGHGAVGAGLARLDADRRSHRGLGRAGHRGALVTGPRRPAHRHLRDPGPARAQPDRPPRRP